MPRSIVLEEVTLNSVIEGEDPISPVYHVFIDGHRSPPYFYRRQAEDAIAAALELGEDSE